MRELSLICLLLSVKLASAQHEGDVWVFGDSCGIKFDSVPHFFQTSIFSSECNASICDSNGNLLYYAGGPSPYSGPPPNTIYVWDSTNAIVQNGNLVYGDASATQGALLLPSLADSNLIFLFSIGEVLKYNVINKATNTIDSLNILLSDSVTEKLCATRHGNGRDWWVIAHQAFSDEFIKLLVSTNGLNLEPIQHIGYALNNTGTYTAGQMVFSPTGNKLCYVNLTGMIELFDFNRCDGLLFNNIHLADSFNGAWPIPHSYYGASFSPNGSKLYVSKFDSLFQFDLNAPSIIQSCTFIARQVNDSVYFGQHLLGPDGKIYIASTTGYDSDTLVANCSLNVINFPDSLGSNCAVSMYSFLLNGYHSLGGLPNIPNYRLGVDSGSVCDTLSTGINENNFTSNIKLFPNPCTNHFKIDLPVKDKKCEIAISDITGKIIYRTSTTTEKIEVNTENISNGLYFVLLQTPDFIKIKKLIITK